MTTHSGLCARRKPKARRGKVLLVNGAATRKENGKEVEIFARRLRRSLGDKRNELTGDHIVELARLAQAFEPGPYTKIFDTTDFGYRKITVERSLRLNFQVSADRIERLRSQPAFIALATSKKRGKAGAEEIEAGRRKQEEILEALHTMDSAVLYKDRAVFVTVLDDALDVAAVRVTASVKKAIQAALGEKDPTAEPCLGDDGNPEPDPDLRDYETVPLKEDIREYFEREVLPHVSDAWISEEPRDCDRKDRRVGRVGYELSFSRNFYQYEPPRALQEIEQELHAIGAELMCLLREVTQ